jgi:cadmium resistance protein CadD (predicted permease)
VADDRKPKPANPVARPVAAKPAPPPPPKPADDDDEAVGSYGVIKETEEELRLAAANKPKFTDVADKFKKSARGPAQALLVMPTNLLVAEAAITGLASVGTVIVGLWPLVFTDAPPSDEEYAERIVIIFAGLVGLAWASIIAIGASKMQALESYAWAMIGAVFGIIPLLAGIFALVALRDERVRKGFAEVEGAVDDDEDGDDEDGDDD